MNVDVTRYISSISISGSTSKEVGTVMNLTATLTTTKKSAAGSTVVESKDVTSEATWTSVGTGSSYCSVSNGQVTATQSNKKSGKSYLILMTYKNSSNTIPVTFTPHQKTITIIGESTNYVGTGLNWTLNASSAVPCAVAGTIKDINHNLSITLNLTPGSSKNKEGSVLLSGSGPNFVLTLNPTSYWSSNEDREYTFQSNINHK